MSERRHGDQTIMHRDGDRLIIEPVRKRGLIALLKTMRALDEPFRRSMIPHPRRSACSDGATIVTAHPGKFKRVRGLKVQNWLP